MLPILGPVLSRARALSMAIAMHFEGQTWLTRVKNGPCMHGSYSCIAVYRLVSGKLHLDSLPARSRLHGILYLVGTYLATKYLGI